MGADAEVPNTDDRVSVAASAQKAGDANAAAVEAHMAGVKRWMRFFVLVKIGLLILVAVAVWRGMG